MKSVRTLMVLVLFTAAAVWFTGCLLKPESNDSTSAPPSVVFTTSSSTTDWVNSASSAVTFSAESATSPVTFSHYTHVTGANQTCTECHSGAADAWSAVTTTAAIKVSAAVRTKVLTMADMYAGKYCGKCHTGAKAFDIKTNCSKCHPATLSSNGPEVTFTTTKVLFSHKAHVDSFKKTCNECHAAGGTKDSPWAMSFKDKAHTMTEIWAGKGCGICHKTGGVAFTCDTSASCKRCHPANHDVVDANVIGSDTCNPCHPTAVTEFQVLNTPSNAAAGGTSHGQLFLTGSHAPSGTPGYSCSECHVHEAVLGKQVAMSLPTLQEHSISCQTCHYPNGKDGGDTNAFRLRKPPEQLCPTCHHMRYTYGYNPIGTMTVGLTNNWTKLPADDPGFPYLAPALVAATSPVGAGSITPVGMSIELKYWAADAKTFLSKGAASAAIAIQDLQYRGLIGGTSPANISGGTYPHDSPEYDTFMGPEAGTFVTFTKDLKGTSLTYGNSLLRNVQNACVGCHMEHDKSKGTYGHTFKATEESTTKVYQSSGDSSFVYATVEADMEAQLATIQKMLDVNKDGTVTWTRSSVDADLKAACNTKGLATATKVIMLGVAWNYNAIEGSSCGGIHNYKFMKDLLGNCITIMNQLKDSTLSSDSAKITWY